MLEVKDITVRYGEKTILDHVGFHVQPGQWLMIVGPNGAGKSTIINAISGGAPHTGEVFFEGENIKKFKPHELARKIGVLTQNHYVSYAFSVEEVVRMGRYAYAPGIFSSRSNTDKDAVEEALEKTGLAEIRHQSVLSLSGGELQRTFLAQLLAQNPELLMLDEPTNHLDLVYQQQIFELVKNWIHDTGRAVVSVVHDLSLARAYGTHALLLGKGKAIAYGTVDAVLTRDRLTEIYGIDVYGWMQAMLGQWTEN